MNHSLRNFLILVFLLATQNAWSAAPDIARIKAAAEAGDRDAQYLYGTSIYLTKPDEKIAWIRKSAEQGHPLAQYELGEYHLRYRSGKQGLKNRRLAILWWSRSAMQGVAKAQARISNAYLSEATIPRNEVNAYIWMSLAVKSEPPFPLGNPNIYRERLKIIVPKISSASVTEAEAILRTFRIGDLKGHNPIEAELVFSQLALQGIIESNDEKVAAVNGTRIRREETRTFDLDTGPATFLCEAITSKSVGLRIVGTPFVRTLGN
ncbi:MAG: tetratricopeptide repeat protein [Opitutaceae bacterium]